VCSHYHKGQPVAEFSQVRLPGLAIPEPILEAAFAEHTYPKYPASIVIEQEGNRA
jgi:hypothetical protein